MALPEFQEYGSFFASPSKARIHPEASSVLTSSMDPHDSPGDSGGAEKMLEKINKNLPLQFLIDKFPTGLDLGERRLMTPNYLSSLVFLAVLPARFKIEKKNPLVPDEQGFCTISSWFERSNFQENFFHNAYNKLAQTHTFTSLSVGGLETLEAKQKRVNSNLYEIFFCGNEEDAMRLSTAYVRITPDPNKNYIFWNYPGVGSSEGESSSVYDLYQSGYQQAKRLMAQGIPAGDITLHGHSLGGGVAIYTARLLHEEGHLVHLNIDRSFGRMALVIPANLIRNMTNKDTGRQSNYVPLISSIMTLALSGLALGTGFAGLVGSVGLVVASATAVIGYIAALCINVVGFLLQEIMKVMGAMIAFPLSLCSLSISDDIHSLFNYIGCYLAYPFNGVAFIIKELLSAIASFINSVINLIGSIVGGVIACAGLMTGSCTGLIFGVLLSIQLFWTEKPQLMPMARAYSAVLYSSCSEMDSVRQIHRLIHADNQLENRTKEQPKISVTNVLDDEVIDPAASLNMGLGLKPGKSSDDENRPLKEKVTSFWYRSGGHGGRLAGLIDDRLSMANP